MVDKQHYYLLYYLLFVMDGVSFLNDNKKIQQQTIIIGLTVAYY